MPVDTITAELDACRPGPAGMNATAPSLAVAEAYCRRLARSHYENFTVASRLLPRRLRQHFCNIYAYCRWADDLADEADSPETSLALLDAWERQLRDCYAGNARHPVFVALADTIRVFGIPIEPLADLLVAFRRDQHVHRYETVADLMEYCRFSANPVGQLVLYLGAAHDPERAALSDSVCTGLQWANFCQDVARDWDRGRLYLPQESLRLAGCDESTFQRREASPAFRRLLAGEVDRAEELLREGLPLVSLVPRDLAVDVALFIEGGLAILAALRAVDFDVWRERPTVSKLQQLRLLARCWWRCRGPFAGRRT